MTWGKGAWGVSQFFAISGFLITTLLLRERDARGSVSLRNFYVRRSLRIFPLYYAVLSLFALYMWLGAPPSPSRQHFFASLPYFASYSSNWFVDLGVSFPVVFAFSWSLATEEQFYLTFPWAVRLSKGIAAPVLLTLGLLLADQGTERGWFGSVLSDLPTVSRMMRSLSAPICLGVLGALVVHCERGFRCVLPWLGRRVSAPLLLVALFWAIAAGIDDLAVHALMALLAVACCLREDHFLGPVLRFRPVAYVGQISYGIYLLHVTVIGALRRVSVGLEQPMVVFYVAALLGSAAVAGASYRWFERPLLRLRGRFGNASASVPYLSDSIAAHAGNAECRFVRSATETESRAIRHA